MAKVVQITNDGITTETTVIYQASSLRLAREYFDQLLEADKQQHADSLDIVSSDCYSYTSGIVKFTIKVLIK